MKDYKCHTKHCDSKPLDTKDCENLITAEKNLLHLSYIGSGTTSRTDVTATYEIVIFNRSCYDLRNVSIVDSLLGLRGDVDPMEGELRPYFTGVFIATPQQTLFPNTFNQIINGGNELLAAGSYVPARSVATLQVRITGRGFFEATPPGTGIPVPGANNVSDISMAVQNTAVIRGDLIKNKLCGCRSSVPIFPIYVKSGERQAINVQRIGLLSPLIEGSLLP
jgi:hypothetical protein